jgi:nucleotide-binding universal stress UspA family protein
MQKILVPVDGSPASQRAVHFVISSINALPGARIQLINVQEPAPAEIVLEAGLAPEQWQAEYEKSGRAAMADACKALEQAGIAYTATVAVGNAADQIAAHAREAGCTLIVMGTRGLGAFASIVLGSVATRVVHAVDCPVTLVK